eukprot:3252424-Rhodomonas_salina.3
MMLRVDAIDAVRCLAGVCTQWHRDRYLARSIVTYVGNAGTEWAEDGGVSLWHLQRGGTNAQRVAGDGWVRSAKVPIPAHLTPVMFLRCGVVL